MYNHLKIVFLFFQDSVYNNFKNITKKTKKILFLQKLLNPKNIVTSLNRQQPFQYPMSYSVPTSNTQLPSYNISPPRLIQPSYHSEQQQQQSDSQKTQHPHHSNPITIEYLLNETKMKEIALNKATHLIDLLKIQVFFQLEVERNSQQQSIQYVQKETKLKYQAIIQKLQQKIIRLEMKIKQYEEQIIKDRREKQNLYQQLNNKQKEEKERNSLYESACRVPRMSKTNSTKDLSPHNYSRRHSHKKHPSINPNYSSQVNPLKRSQSSFFQQADLAKQAQLFRFEKAFLASYIIKSQEKDEKLMQQLKSLLPSAHDEQHESFSTIKMLKSIKSYEKQLQQTLKQQSQKQKQSENRVKQYQEMMKIQQLIIIQLNRQISEYDDVSKIFLKSFTDFCSQLFHSSDFQSLNHFSIYSTTTNSTNFPNASNFLSSLASKHSLSSQENFLIQQFTQSIQKSQQSVRQFMKKHKNKLKQKLQNMEGQNKELKRILDDMIKLVKQNKRLNVGGITGMGK